MIEAAKSQRLKEGKGQFKRRREVKRCNQVKMGHGGTLDPLATGVLIVGIGSATKMLPQFLDCTKTYETTVVFGASTDTYDRVGRIINKRPYDHITKEMVLKELVGFRGKQKQVPPLYSALKMNGKPLYEYAREGKAIPREIAARDVDAAEVELVEWYEPGTHNHRWPTEEAEAAERNLAEQVWRVKKLQETSKQLTPEERKEDDQAIAAHETFKRKFEARQDELITDQPKKRRQGGQEALMSGALGSLPPPGYSTKGSNLVPASPDQDTPPPWDDKGPPACKIRLTVTSGYYVRSFCHDLGAKLESAGIMAELCRVRQSDFTVGGINTLDYDDLTKGEEVWGPKVADMLARWNGEPEGHWPRCATAPKPSKESDDSPSLQENEQRMGGSSGKQGQETQQSPRAEKRKRSPAQDEASPVPRKVQAAAHGGSNTKPGRSEDDKEWGGFEK